jgi:uncharacterized protein (DUF58 family)
MAGSQEKYLRPDVIQQVKRLDLRARFIVEGFLVGLQKSPFQGFSAEFSEHKKYEQGDDLSQMDWNVYARTDRHYIKKFEAETNLTGYLVVDLSKSMDYPANLDGDRLTKFDYALCLAAALTYMMVGQSDAVGLVAFDSKVRLSLPPRSRRTQLAAIIAALSGTRADGPSDLPAALHEVAALVRRRSLAMVFSDLLPAENGSGDLAAETDRVLKSLHHLRHGGTDVILFHILDQSEVEFPFAGNTTFVGQETDARLPPGEAEAFKAAYLEEVRAFRERYRIGCQRGGIDYVPLHTGMPFDKALVSYLAERRGR